MKASVLTLVPLAIASFAISGHAVGAVLDSTATLQHTLAGPTFSQAGDISHAGQATGATLSSGASIQITLGSRTPTSNSNATPRSSLDEPSAYIQNVSRHNPVGVSALTTGDITGTAPRLTLHSTSAVPETQTYALMLAGLGLVAGIARHRSKKQ
jgi:hypothetical protein